MAAESRSSSRNYIDLIADEDDKQGAPLQPALVRPMRDYLLSLIMTMRGARQETR